MKARNENGNGSGAKKAAASEKGTLPRWVFCGYVQAVHTGKSKQFPCDYVRFQVKPNGTHKDAEAYAVVFAVTVPHSLGVELEVGDAIIMEGTVNSWFKDDSLYGKWYRLELVADKVREWDGLFKSEHKPKPEPKPEPLPADFAEFEGEIIGGNRRFEGG